MKAKLVQCFKHKTKLGVTNDPITLNIEDIQNLINAEVKNDIARNILSKVFKELMEKERDEYLENKAYQRDPNRSTYRNGY